MSKQKHCIKCGHQIEKPGLFEMQELFERTPQAVWREYFDNGYLWYQAVAEELSYAD